MKNQKTRILLFDIDGTLLYGGGVGREAINQSFQSLFGVAEAFEGISAVGKVDPGLLQECAKKALGRDLNQTEYLNLVSTYIENFEKYISTKNTIQLLPGVEQLLEALSRVENVMVGNQTGNFHATAQLKLIGGGIDQFFQFGGYGCDADDRAVICGLAVERAKSLLGDNSKEAELVLIGDSPNDMLAGKAIGARTLGVMTGGVSPKLLREHGADLIQEDLSDLESTIDWLINGQANA